MATTKNHKITKTLGKAIAYAIGDKVEERVKDNIRESVAYVIDDKTGKAVYPTMYCTLNCTNTENPVKSFEEIIKKFGSAELKEGNARTKNGAPVLAWHYHQNFEGHVDPIIANEIGQRLAKEVFGNYPVVIGTHTNTENTHNHIIICAWNLDGGKWNQCNAAYRHVREVSDRLCEEYGLSVLRDTKKQKLLKWTDKDGQVHYYEPTERKNELLQQRESGEISVDDVGSYRNTFPYEQTLSKEETNREIIRQDIDRLLPVATTYEHLLEMLRQIGYIVNDKKKNGDWLKHISFQSPSADKATREDKIGDGGFYLRENLEQIIAEFAAERAKEKLTGKPQEAEQSIKNDEGCLTIEEATVAKKKPPYFEEYIYSKTVLVDIDEDVRTVKDKNGGFSTVPRGEAEKTIIRDVRVKDNELRLIDTAEIDRLIKEQKAEKGKGTSKNRQEILLRQINEGFHVLRFMEKQDLYSQKQINAITESTWKKYNECMKSLNTLEMLVNHLDMVLQVPQKAEIIETRIKRMKGNCDYTENEMQGDVEQLKEYRATIQKYKLTDPEGIKKLTAQVEHSKGKIMQLQSVLSVHHERLAEYNRCMSVLARIDREQGRDNKEIMDEYRAIQKQGEEQAKQNEEKRNKRKAAER